MSRQSPFPVVPARRPRTPLDSAATPSAYPQTRPAPPKIPSTSPLMINRVRPQTPSDPQGSNSAQPARPARSERRPRQTSQHSQVQVPSHYEPRPESSRSNGTRTPNSYHHSQGQGNGIRESDYSDNHVRYAQDDEPDPYGGMQDQDGGGGEQVESPKALSSVIAAFQQAGTRRRGATTSTVASDHEMDRRRERERERIARAARAQARATGDIDAVLDEVREEWADVIEEDFNPVTLALALLDDSSVGRDINSFRDTKLSLEHALKGSVDKHYQAFAASLPHHSSLLTSLTQTQAEISDSRSRLIEARDALGNKRADLVQLWSRGQALDEMMRLLDEIEQIKSVPDTLESLISEKRLLQAAILLVKSLKTISKPDMQEIGAVADLRAYLTGQESSLRDILIDELHSHLYLKAFWCDSRWLSYVPNQNNLPAVEFDQQGALSLDINNPGSAGNRSRLDRYLTQLNLRPTNESPIDSDGDPSSSVFRAQHSLSHGHAPSTSSFTSTTNGPQSTINSTSNITQATSSAETQNQNPESDSFAYIEMLLESLAVLGKLVGALDVVVTRLPVEVYNLVETTIDEVADRSDFVRGSFPTAGSGASGNGGTAMATTAYVFVEEGHPGVGASAVSSSGGILGASSLRLAALEASAKETDHETLRDLFWTLYSKLDAVLQGFRVTYEVANRIGQRRDFKDTSGIKPGALFPLVEIWTPVQTEVRTLLREYLTDDERASISGRNPIASINEVLRAGTVGGRDKSKPVFRFSDTDAKLAAKALKKHDDELLRVLKETVPGLVNGPSETASSATIAVLGLEDRFAGAGQHRLLTRPDAFHVSVLFEPTLTWLDRVSDVFPASSSIVTSDATSMLDDFVLNVYLPQLEEKVLSLFHQTVSSPDAFHEDPGWKLLSAQPLVKSSTQLIALINSLCAIMRVTPFHRENYSRLILGVIIQFYQRCSDCFHNLVSRADAVPGVVDSAQLLPPATWAQNSDIASCLSALYTTPPEQTDSKRALCEKQTRFEWKLMANKPVKKEDTLGATRNITSLATLYQSLVWFIAQLSHLRELAEDPQSPIKEESGTAVLTAKTPFSPRVQAISLASPDSGLRLPLTRAMVLRFDALLKTYDQLAELILCTIRLDLRCRTIHLLQDGMQQNQYKLDQEPQEPDQYVLDLNAELASYDDCLSVTLAERERRFVFEGLGALMEHLLISEARHIRFANALGVQKLMRNITTLQQSLRAIDDDETSQTSIEFEKARKYYGMFSITPAEMLGIAREHPQFSFDEYKAMLNLQSGVDQALGDNAPGNSEYRMHLIDLHALTIDDVGS